MIFKKHLIIIELPLNDQETRILKEKIDEYKHSSIISIIANSKELKIHEVYL